MSPSPAPLRPAGPLGRLGAVVGVLLAGVLSPGCGGGGGGGVPDPAAPGTLLPLAVEGTFAPGGGQYVGFPPEALISAAEGGFVAFVANLSGTSTPRALFVAQPDGAVMRVFGVGEAVPPVNGATGTFSDFRRVWMRAGGVVVVDADVAAGVTRGFFSARGNDQGGIVDKTCAACYGNALPAAVGGTLDDIDEPVTVVTGDARILFHGTSTSGVHGIFRVDHAGALLDSIAYTGQSTGTESFGTDFRAVGVDPTGTFFVVAAALTGGAATEGIAATNDRTAFTLVAKNGDVPPDSGGRPFTDVESGARLHVSWEGGNHPAYVTWRGTVSGGGADHGLFRRAFWNSGLFTLAPIDGVVGAGEPVVGAGPGAVSSDVRDVEQAEGATSVVFRTDVAAGTTSHVFARLAPATGAIAEFFREGTSAPGGSQFGLAYPSLSTTGLSDAADRLGALAFTAFLADGTSGVFWDVPGAGCYRVVRQGGAAPGTSGGVFGSFATPSTVSISVGVIAFRAPLVGGSGFTGVFRQH